MTGVPHLPTLVTTDLAAITRGRPFPEERLRSGGTSGIGWVPANLCLTAFNTIADPNPFGSVGDLRILPDPSARFTTGGTLKETPFDLVMGDIVTLDGAPWDCCPRHFLREALAMLKAETGLSILAAFEHEFQLAGAGPAGHAFSFEALRQADPFVPRLLACLEEAGAEPELAFAEYGANQFEATLAPADGLAAADRAVALREIVRELAKGLGWRASFAPKPSLEGVGNGVHIHLSLVAEDGAPATYDAAGPGRLSARAGSFFAGILRHMQALTAVAAPAAPSYFRLKPHNWSASYTWLGDRDREASLRICPTVSIGGRDPAAQFNVEYRAADALANPHLALGVLVRAGLEGLRAGLAAPPIVSGDPGTMSEAERAELGLRRLPESCEAALAALEGDEVARGWFPPDLFASFLAVRRTELAAVTGREPAEVCEIYRMLY
ncbi:glutamine synthetase family protein [Aureimonas leprariae]|uniref:Glutamine synthetase n=1 Tax=Plantimonas leprariae TaxID=2615207 RepID=A0A7V7PMQ2_9HYPH|nr:glutamine synthetase family protein [Aureimonas leprariae]KAB0678471.1 glutamine synthetase [Aureimonas leprariae]